MPNSLTLRQRVGHWLVGDTISPIEQRLNELAAQTEVGKPSLLASRIKSNAYWTAGLLPLSGGISGTIGRNQDLIQDKYGAALAYLLVEPVYRSVNWISDNIGRMRWRLVDIATDQPVDTSESPDPNHPLAISLKRTEQESNRSDGLFKLWAANLLLYGENPLEIVRNRFEYVHRFKWLNALGVTVNAPSGVIVGYFYSGAGGSYPLTPYEVAYDYVMNPFDDVRGHSPTLTAIQKANIELNADRTWSAYYRNGARPDGLVTPKNGDLNAETLDIITTTWQTFKGSANSGKIGILPMAADVTLYPERDFTKQIPLSEHMQRAIYRIFGVPPTLAGDTAAGPYQGNNDAVLEGAFETALKPHADGIAKFVNLRLLPLFPDAPRVRFEFDYSDYDFIGDNEKNRVEVVTRKLEAGAVDMYSAQVELGNQKPDERLKGLYIINGTPVPIDALGTLWERQYQALPNPVGPGQPLTTSTPLIDVTPVAMPQLPAPTPTTNAEQAPTNVDSTEGLNGAQITAALDILAGVTTGTTAPEVAREQLMALGITPERVDVMVNETVQNRSSTPTQPAPQESQPTEEDIQERLSKRDAAVRTELSAWQKFALSGKVKARPFEPEHTRGDLADGINDALKAAETPEAIKTVFDGAFARLAVKAIDGTKTQFQNDFSELLDSARKGDISRSQFSARMRQLFIRYGFQAYTNGLKDGGVDEEPDEEETAEIEKLLAEQSPYISDLARVIFKEDGVSDAQADVKPDLWFNKSLYPFYTAGLASADANGLYEFVEEEETVDTCIQCGKLVGQRHRLKDWRRKNLVPRENTEAFDCGGFQCGHGLKKANGKARGVWLS